MRRRGRMGLIGVMGAGCCLVFGQSYPDGAKAPPLPPTAPGGGATNRYHLTLGWDGVTNASWYAVVVRSNGVEVQRRWSMTNSVTVSNLDGELSAYGFTAVATSGLEVVMWDGVRGSNAAFQVGYETAESAGAVLRWMRVLESDRLGGEWRLLGTNEFVPSGPQHFIGLTNWRAEKELRRD